MTVLVDQGAYIYKRQLYKDLLPTIAAIVFFSPQDNHVGGGANVYANGINYLGNTAAANQITYLHYAGYFWSSKTYFTTTSQILTANGIYDSGDFGSGALCANYLLNPDIYQTVFDSLKFTYEELLSLGLPTYQQCSLCDDDNCNTLCRSNNPCR